MRKVSLGITSILLFLCFLFGGVALGMEKPSNVEIKKRIGQILAKRTLNCLQQPFTISQKSVNNGQLSEREKDDLQKRIFPIPADIPGEYQGFCLYLVNAELDSDRLALITNFLKNSTVISGNKQLGHWANVFTAIILNGNKLRFLLDNIFDGFNNLALIDLRDNELDEKDMILLEKIQEKLYRKGCNGIELPMVIEGKGNKLSWIQFWMAIAYEKKLQAFS